MKVCLAENHGVRTQAHTLNGSPG